MKKVLRVIGSLFLLIVIFIVGFLIWNSKRQLVSKNYYKEIETGGDIEAKYLGVGPYRDVQLKEIAVMQNFKKYLIYYPTDITRINKKFPLIICSNGTGVPASKCRALLKRMATWGFIVVGTDEEYSWNGFSSEMCLRLMIKLNDAEVVFDWSSNPFYQSVDLENIGLMGHSQGGVGVINAATVANHADFYMILYDNNLTDMILDTIKDVSGPKAEMDNKEAYGKAFIAYGIYGWLMEWMSRGMKESEEEINAMLTFPDSRQM